MRNFKLILIALSALAAVASFAEDRRIWVGVGGFYPTNKTIKDIFGSSLRFDFDAGGTQPTSNWKVGPDLNLIRGSRNGSKFAVVPIGIATHKLLGDEKSAAKPYIKLAAGITYNDYSINLPLSSGGTQYVSNKKIGTGASAEIGIYINEKIRATARYNLFSKVDGLDFSGLSVSVQYAIAKF